MAPIMLTLSCGRSFPLRINMAALRRGRDEGLDLSPLLGSADVDFAAQADADPLGTMLSLVDVAYLGVIGADPSVTREAFDALVEAHDMAAVGQAVGTLMARVNTPDVPKDEPSAGTATP